MDFDGVIPGTYNFNYSLVAMAPCENQDYQISILVEDCQCPSVAIATPNPVCNDVGILNLQDLVITTDSGSWLLTGTPVGTNPATLIGTELTINDSDPGVYEFTFSLNNPPPSGCPSSASVMLEVAAAANAGLDNSLISCNTNEHSSRFEYIIK